MSPSLEGRIDFPQDDAYARTNIYSPLDLPSTARVGLFLPGSSEMQEPTIKHAWAFVNGQNLFDAAKKAFGYSYPNYDIGELALSV